MGRLAITPLFDSENEPGSRVAKTLYKLAPAERLLLRGLRLWSYGRKGQSGSQISHATADWRQAFVASLEPAQMRDGRSPKIQITEFIFEDALADFDTFLAILLGGPKQVWRFHHPSCLSIDASEAALLDLLRLMQSGDAAAATTLLRHHVDEDRGERALRYLGNVTRMLHGAGLSLPLSLPGDPGLTLTH